MAPTRQEVTVPPGSSRVRCGEFTMIGYGSGAALAEGQPLPRNQDHAQRHARRKHRRCPSRCLVCDARSKSGLAPRSSTGSPTPCTEAFSPPQRGRHPPPWAFIAGLTRVHRSYSIQAPRTQAMRERGARPAAGREVMPARHGVSVTDGRSPLIRLDMIRSRLLYWPCRSTHQARTSTTSCRDRGVRN